MKALVLNNFLLVSIEIYMRNKNKCQWVAQGLNGCTEEEELQISLMEIPPNVLVGTYYSKVKKRKAILVTGHGNP
jgi:hypothetical protein